MSINKLQEHVNKFVSGNDISIQWAKDAETLLDQLEQENILEEGILDDFQDNLSIYRPGGGAHLIDELEMKKKCIKFIEAIEKKFN